MSEPTTTMRDALEAAFKGVEEPAVEAAPELNEQIEIEIPDVSAEPAATIEESPAAEEANLDELATAESQGDNNEVQQPLRGDDGKFKAKEDGIQPGPKPGPKPQGERAPASWKPDVREHWGQLPEPVRAEIARREVEVQRTLQESAEARKNYDAVMRTVAPYEAFIKAEGSNPIQAIDNLMSTAARLRTGTAPELATMVAGIVNQFGIGRFGNQFIELLDSALAGQAPKQDNNQAAIEQVLSQKLAPVQQMLTQFQQAQLQQQQLAQQQAVNEVEQFLAKAEFGNDVREEMADILELAQRKGQNLSLADAYKKAVMMNDTVRTVLEQRARAKSAQVSTSAVQRARSAAVSVSGSAPVGSMQAPPTDVRSAIEAAIVATNR